MKKIRYYREQAKMTQAELAARVGVSPEAVCQWETGATKPALSSLVKAAKTLECSVDDLLDDEPLCVHGANPLTGVPGCVGPLG